MNNLISHKEQSTAISLDNVAAIYFNNIKNKSLSQFRMYFSLQTIDSDVGKICEEWFFADHGEALRVYNSILDRFSNEI